MKKSMNVPRMVELALLTAIVLLLAFTPIGYLKVGPLSISLLTIPVAIGAITLGPGAGAFLGTIFGLTSFAQCFGADAFGAALLSISPLLTFLVCVPTRLLMGFLTGVIFRALKRTDRTRIVSYVISSLMAPVMNTVFFMSVLMLGFWNTDYIQSLNVAKINVLPFVLTMIGLNGIVEIISCTVVGTAVCKALAKAFPETAGRDIPSGKTIRTSGSK